MNLVNLFRALWRKICFVAPRRKTNLFWRGGKQVHLVHQFTKLRKPTKGFLIMSHFWAKEVNQMNIGELICCLAAKICHGERPGW